MTDRQKKLNRQIRFRAVFVIGVVLLVGFFIWRGSLDDIGEILKDPMKYETKTVRLLGKTRSVFSIPFIGGIYKFDDGTGSMWVMSRIDITPNNKMLFIEGEVKSKSRLDIDEIPSKWQVELFSKREFGPIIVEKNRRCFPF